jgi:hypothetical protein
VRPPRPTRRKASGGVIHVRQVPLARLTVPPVRGRVITLRRKTIGWKDDFPIHQEVEDFAGRKRSFVIDCHEGPLGYTVRASEAGKQALGYEFASYSETSPYAALGRVRAKMKRGLATRHLSGGKGPREMLHDSLEGRITVRAGEVVVVVDGIALGIEDLARFLAAREGWGFEMRILDSLD